MSGVGQKLCCWVRVGPKMFLLGLFFVFVDARLSKTVFVGCVLVRKCLFLSGNVFWVRVGPKLFLLGACWSEHVFVGPVFCFC